LQPLLRSPDALGLVLDHGSARVSVIYDGASLINPGHKQSHSVRSRHGLAVVGRVALPEVEHLVRNTLGQSLDLHAFVEDEPVVLGLDSGDVDQRFCIRVQPVIMINKSNGRLKGNYPEEAQAMHSSSSKIFSIELGTWSLDWMRRSAASTTPPRVLRAMAEEPSFIDSMAYSTLIKELLEAVCLRERKCSLLGRIRS